MISIVLDLKKNQDIIIILNYFRINIVKRGKNPNNIGFDLGYYLITILSKIMSWKFNEDGQKLEIYLKVSWIFC